MYPLILLVIGCLLNTIKADNHLNNMTFPDTFMFGCATAAYQIEGGWNANGKGESIWDRFTHQVPSPIKNNDTGDVACDSYHKYKEDVALLVDLGVTHYRFSISWSRILPTGLINEINLDGVDYYRALIHELKENNIEPFVTLFHYDTPQGIEDLGGWRNPFIETWFSDYARLCFELFGDDVKYWMTFNEAKQTCVLGYGTGVYAPGVKSPGVAEYMCIHNVLKAHAAAWHVYNDEFRTTQKGQVGIVIDSSWFQPENESLQADIDASETLLQFTFGIFATPLYMGDYPDIVKENVERRSLAQGYLRSRLPEFTEEEKIKLKGTVDLLGVNTYTSSMVRPLDVPDPEGKGLNSDCEVYQYQPDDWEKTDDVWMRVTPWGSGELVKWIARTYGNPPMIITENGRSDTGTLDDDARITFLMEYISSIKNAMDDNNLDIRGYTVWSLLDNFEWLFGYSSKFGLYQVDFDSPDRTRTPKKSVEYYKKLIRTRCIVDSCVN
ncbi:myrosinase 1-like isoform X1 [Diorhabda carinulata]|uniref:myrosinase 1-like isoform X1 n=2 Tax=Diorhabda carinulata TaxID=1163345 RepID=UPI0025A1DDE9|nr:myrosinase 1-like isoform X1 [Diorhabda carinulata]